MDGFASSIPTDDAVLDRLARDFATRAAAHHRDGSFPFDGFDRLAEAGLTGLVTPTAFGGRGAGLAEAARVIGRIAWGNPSTALVLVMHDLMLARHGPRLAACSIR